MANTTTRNIRTGVMVIAATTFLIVALYVIGNKRNLFGSTFRISARFYNVNGLMEGNNVRLSGIDVGTVESVEIVSDSTVNVVMVIEDKVQPYIRKNAIASVGTDGLMGSKLVNINSVKGYAEMIKEGDVLNTLRPFETDEMLRTLNTTNENLMDITGDLKEIAHRINSKNSLWRIVMDTTVADHVKKIITDVSSFTGRSDMVMADLGTIVKDVRKGKGTVGTLLSDTSLSAEFKTTLAQFKTAATRVSAVSDNLQQLSDSISKGSGTVGTLLNDTVLARDIGQTVKNIQQGAQGFSENMEALKHNILFRKYFRKKNKQK